MVLDDLRGGGEECLVGAPAHQRVAVVGGRGRVQHEGSRHVAAPGEARVERLKRMIQSDDSELNSGGLTTNFQN